MGNALYPIVIISQVKFVWTVLRGIRFIRICAEPPIAPHLADQNAPSVRLISSWAEIYASRKSAFQQRLQEMNVSSAKRVSSILKETAMFRLTCARTISRTSTSVENASKMPTCWTKSVIAWIMPPKLNRLVSTPSADPLPPTISPLINVCAKTIITNHRQTYWALVSWMDVQTTQWIPTTLLFSTLFRMLANNSILYIQPVRLPVKRWTSLEVPIMQAIIRLYLALRD